MPIKEQDKPFIADQLIKQHKTNNDDNPRSYAGPEQIVYEGSKVHLEGHSYPPHQKLVWKQIDGPPVKLEYEKKENPTEYSQNPSFTAPYITFNINNNKKDNNKSRPYTKLTFELITKDKSETSSSLHLL